MTSMRRLNRRLARWHRYVRRYTRADEVYDPYYDEYPGCKEPPGFWRAASAAGRERQARRMRRWISNDEVPF